MTQPNHHNKQQQWQQIDAADRIAKIALDHYDTILPGNKGKPNRDRNEWTVYSAIVAEEEGGDADQVLGPGYWVVSCATGTKCCNNTSLSSSSSSSSEFDSSTTSKSCVLRDCHAEALARRGLVRLLHRQMKYLERRQGIQNECHVDSSNKFVKKQGYVSVEKSEDREKDRSGPLPLLLERSVDDDDGVSDDDEDKDGNNSKRTMKFRLRREVRLHMYISDSPCGDASIYPLINRNDNDDDRVQFTGAKVIIPSSNSSDGRQQQGERDLGVYDGMVPLVCPKAVDMPLSNNATMDSMTIAREPCQQILGRLRTKSSRSNIFLDRRSTSMSCSDKIVRWGILGIQGTLPLHSIVHPIYLSSIVVSRDPRTTRDHNHTAANDVDGQLNALRRSTIDRINMVRRDLLAWSSTFTIGSPRTVKLSPSLQQLLNVHMITPTIHITERHRFECGKSMTEDRVVKLEQSVAENSIHEVGTLKTDDAERTRQITYDSDDGSFPRNGITNSRKRKNHGDEDNMNHNVRDVVVEVKKKEEGDLKGNCHREVMTNPNMATARPKRRTTQKKIKHPPCGFSINWQQPIPTSLSCSLHDDSDRLDNDDDVELLVGARGIKHGKKPKCLQDYETLQSRLSRASMIKCHQSRRRRCCCWTGVQQQRKQEEEEEQPQALTASRQKISFSSPSSLLSSSSPTRQAHHNKAGTSGQGQEEEQLTYQKYKQHGGDDRVRLEMNISSSVDNNDRSNDNPPDNTTTTRTTTIVQLHRLIKERILFTGHNNGMKCGNNNLKDDVDDTLDQDHHQHPRNSTGADINRPLAGWLVSSNENDFPIVHHDERRVR